MRTWNQVREELLAEDPEFKRGYERLGPLYRLIGDVIHLRSEQGLTQKDVAERMGKQQPSVARFEAGNTVPTLTFLQDIAEALGAKLVVRIEPIEAGSDIPVGDAAGAAPKPKASKTRRRQAVKA